MVFGFLRPADEQAAEAVEPGVGALDDPAAGAEAGVALEQVFLLAAGADVRGEAVLAHQFVHLRVVIALVQAQALRSLGGDVRPVDHDVLERLTQQPEVVGVRARDLESERRAPALAQQ